MASRFLALLSAAPLLLWGCQNASVTAPNPEQVRLSTFATQSIPLDTALGEQLAPNEPAAIGAIENAILTSLRKSYANQPLMTRDVHAKHHGCPKAFFEVQNTQLPPALRVGVFAQNGKVYPSWTRFSNGAGKPKPDKEGDVRGFALKLMGVPGPKLLAKEAHAQTQDFLFINTNTFFIDSLKDYQRFIEATNAGALSLAGFAITHPRVVYRIYKIFSQKYGNPLDIDFYSSTPYKLGPAAIKFRAKPCATPPTPIPANPGPNYLREVLSQSLQKGSACFQMMVQVQTNPREMPIEDSTQAWDETKAPWIPVGRITIPTQRFDSPEQMSFCENMSYTPWHSLPEHKPLGAANRARKSVYEAVSEFRHSHNKAVRREPTSHNLL